MNSVTLQLLVLASVALPVAVARAEDAPFAPSALQTLLPSTEEAPSSGWCPDWCKGWFHTLRCVSVPDTKKIPKVQYTARCETFCGSVCACGLLAKLFGSDCGDCGTVRTRHVLLKKTVTEECPGGKCVVPHCTDCYWVPHPPFTPTPR